jgi:hypothetical protein
MWEWPSPARYWSLEAEINFIPLSSIEPRFLGSLSHGQLLKETVKKIRDQKYNKGCTIFFKDKRFFVLLKLGVKTSREEKKYTLKRNEI